MEQDGTTPPRRFRGVAIATIIFASLALNGVLLWRWFATDDRVRAASGAAAPGAQQPAGSPPSPPPVKPREAEKTRERRQIETGPSRPIDGGRKAPGVEAGLRSRQLDPSPPEAARSQANARHAPDGATPTNGSTPAPAIAQSPPEAIPRASDARAQGPATPSPGPRTSRVPSNPAGAPPPGIEAVSPPAGAAPMDEEEAASPEEFATVEPNTPAEFDPDSDRTPPILEAIRFDPPVVEGGNATTITVQARDDLSGVKSFRGELRSPNGLAILPFWSQSSRGGIVSTFTIAVPREAETGVWYVSTLTLIDGADNSSLARAASAATAPPGGTLTVSSPDSDSIPPEVLQVWFDVTTVGDGEKNVIGIEARDDRSGVASIMGACQSPSGSALIWFNCTLNEQSGIWEGGVPIPRDADCGEWVVHHLEAKDKAGNMTLLNAGSPLLTRATFHVSSGADCDSTPPTLEAFDLSPTIVSNETATEILVTATVHDEGTGATTMSGWFEGPVSQGGQVPRNFFYCSPDPKDPEAPWTGKVRVPQLAAKGTWKVGVIRLQDKALNQRQYTAGDPVVSGRVFEVE